MCECRAGLHHLAAEAIRQTRRIEVQQQTDVDAAQSLSVILCARHNRREGAYYAGQSEETSA